MKRRRPAAVAVGHGDARYLFSLEKGQPFFLVGAQTGERLGVPQLDAGMSEVKKHGRRQRGAGQRAADEEKKE